MNATPHTPDDRPLAFERLVVVRNLHSTNVGTAERQYTDIFEARPDLDRIILDTTPDKSANRAQLRETLRSGDLLLIAGGDGTVSETINTLITSRLPRIHVPVLPLWGGNGNDLASSLNGRRYHSQPHKILEEARAIAIHPIRSRLIDEEFGIRQRIGICYMGIGGTALGAQKLNAESYRHHFWYKQTVIRQLMELQALGSSALRTPSFTIQDADGLHRLVERTVANGPRMAKYARFPVDIAARELYVADVESNRPDKALRWIGGLALQPLVAPVPGRYLPHNQSLEFTIGDTPTLIQVDAEAEPLPPGARVTIRQAHQRFYALSTNTHP